MVDELLAGPILRRTTPELICVWLATDQEAVFKLTILNGKTPIGESDLSKIAESRCQLGQHLFVYLLQARPKEAEQRFPNDVLLSYQLDQITDSGEVSIDLNKLGLTYDNSAVPTFFIPSQLNAILHGSCRKPHGHVAINKENADALSFGDDKLSYTHGDLANRPALLLLTGDQIYADDVAGSLLKLLAEKVAVLLGYREQLPITQSESMFAYPYINDRQAIAKHQAGFSSTEAENHLFTFGEFAAMYIYVFGNAQNWQPDFESEHNDTLTKALQAFHATLPKVRRLLANIPTYMIFDDHDVTDDWNITGGWYDKVRSLALGRRVVANALASFWAFQGWGDDPDNADVVMINSITTYLQSANPTVLQIEHYELYTWKHRGWGFSLPTNPPIIAIDSRTQRQPDGAFYPPQLLDRYALDWLKVEWAKLVDQKNSPIEWPILVATTPVMGFAPVEGLSQFLLWIADAFEGFVVIRIIEKLFRAEGLITGNLVNKLDAESWISNRDGFGKFLSSLLLRMNVKQCIFLSGDVHYSFTAKAQFKSHEQILNCWQLTSSALCNTPSDDGRLTSVVGKADGKAGHNNWWALNPSQRWSTTIEYQAEQVTGKRITSECNIGLVEFKQGKPIKHSLLINAKLAAKEFSL